MSFTTRWYRLTSKKRYHQTPLIHRSSSYPSDDFVLRPTTYTHNYRKRPGAFRRKCNVKYARVEGFLSRKLGSKSKPMSANAQGKQRHVDYMCSPALYGFDSPADDIGTSARCVKLASGIENPDEYEELVTARLWKQVDDAILQGSDLHFELKVRHAGRADWVMAALEEVTRGERPGELLAGPKPAHGAEGTPSPKSGGGLGRVDSAMPSPARTPSRWSRLSWPWLRKSFSFKHSDTDDSSPGTSIPESALPPTPGFAEEEEHRVSLRVTSTGHVFMQVSQEDCDTVVPLDDHVSEDLVRRLYFRREKNASWAWRRPDLRRFGSQAPGGLGIRIAG